MASDPRSRRRLARRARLAAALLLAVLLASCTSPDFRRPRFFRGHWPDTVKRKPHAGLLRVPIPRPYLLVKRAAAGEALDFQVVYLPDSEEEMWIEPRRPKAPLQVAFDEAGFLRELAGSFKTGRTQIGGGTPDPQPVAALRFSELGRTGSLQPGLYRIVTADPQGGPVPRLEPVQLQPAAPPEALRLDAILFRTCPAAPEVVQRIDVTADRGDVDALARLAGRITVFRGRDPVDLSGATVQGRSLSVPVDAGCAGPFANYRVTVSPEDLAPGSLLEAAFPSEAQLADLRPRAEIHLVRDDAGQPRYLAVEISPGRGSPAALPTSLDSPAVLLLVNGKVSRSARIAQGPADGNVFLVDLGEADARSIFFSLVPRSAAGLAGEPASFTWTASEPRREEPKKPEAIVVQEGDLEIGAGGRVLTLVLGVPPDRMDLERTMSRNRERLWKDVRCTRRSAAQVACTGTLVAVGKSQFDVYCLGEEKPCLSVGVKE
jgi:hypothetical protein